MPKFYLDRFNKLEHTGEGLASLLVDRLGFAPQVVEQSVKPGEDVNAAVNSLIAGKADRLAEQLAKMQRNPRGNAEQRARLREELAEITPQVSGILHGKLVA